MRYRLNEVPGSVKVPPSLVCIVIVSSPFDPRIGLGDFAYGDSMKQASDLQFRIRTHPVEIGNQPRPS